LSIEPLLREANLWRESLAGSDRAWLLRVIDLLKPRARRVADMVEHGRFFFVDTVEYDAAAVEKHLSTPGLASHVSALRAAFERLDDFEAGRIEAELRAIAGARGVKAALLIHSARVAATGQGVSPGIFDVLALLGRERTVSRLQRLVRFLESGEA
jgi:glutamyl/glutaminyl-tRNA synthetase